MRWGPGLPSPVAVTHLVDAYAESAEAHLAP